MSSIEQAKSASIIDGHHIDSDSDIRQYLTFILDNEEYGFPIKSVMEIRGWEEPTRVPDCPHYVKGVINIRGIVVPVINLREKLSMSHKDSNKFTVTIVVQVMGTEGDDKTRVVGFVVDAVSEVYNFQESDLQSVPENTTIEKRYIKNLVVSDNNILILLDPNELLDE